MPNNVDLSLPYVEGYMYEIHEAIRDGEIGETELRKEMLGQIAPFLVDEGTPVNWFEGARSARWQGSLGVMCAVHVPDHSEASFSIVDRQRAVTRRFVHGEEVSREEAERRLKWAFSIQSGRTWLHIFADAETGEVGVSRQEGFVCLFDFLEDESKTLAQLEDYLSNVFYPGGGARSLG
jgi:hypothetical protein